MYFAQQVVNGLTIGSFYSLVALGYTMVYGILRMINFAHGELFMLGSYFGFTAVISFGLMGVLKSPFLGALVVMLMVMGGVALAGALVERVAYRPLRKSTRLAAVVSALGASVFLQNAVMLTYGASYKVYPENLLPEVFFTLLGARFSLLRLVVLGMSLLLMFLLYIIIQKTVIGAAIRACALDHDAARLMGIDVNRIIRLVFLIGPALGGAAGVMVGFFYREIYFTMGWTYGLKAFTSAVLGGIGNIPGAMLGGILLGLLEAFGAGYVSSAWKDAFAFVILIVILIVRPTGILGERVAEKV